MKIVARDASAGIVLAGFVDRFEVSGHGLAVILRDGSGRFWMPPPAEEILAFRQGSDGGFGLLSTVAGEGGRVATLSTFEADGAFSGEDRGRESGLTSVFETAYALDPEDGQPQEPAPRGAPDPGPGASRGSAQDFSPAMEGATRTGTAARAEEAGSPGKASDATSGTARTDAAADAAIAADSSIPVPGEYEPEAAPSFAAQAETATAAQAALPQGAANGIIVQFAPGATQADVAAAAAAVGGQASAPGRAGGPLGDRGLLQEITPGQGLSPEKAVEILAKLPGVAFAEENWSITADIADDDYYTDGSLWGMYGDETSPANSFGSQSGEAWAAGHTGSTSTVIGVVDTGIDPTHVDLYQNIWLNQEEIPTGLMSEIVDIDGDGLVTFRDLNAIENAALVTDANGNGRIDAIDLLSDGSWADGIDTDGNGFVDDFYGWDFVDNDNNPFEDFGAGAPGAADSFHGTHVAGTIGASGGDATGVAGVSWDVQIAAMRFMTSTGGSTFDAVQSLDYFTAQALDSPGQNFVATNNSWGGGGYSSSLENAIADGARAGVLFVGSAGNSGNNNDANPYYPSSFDTTAEAGYDGVISVASLKSNGALSGFSSYGAESVDLAAPGSGIVSTQAGGGYKYASGTSMAAPHVTGALALAAAANPDLTAAELRAALFGATLDTGSLGGLVATNGRLDVDALLAGVALSAPLPTVTIASATDDVGTVTGAVADGGVTNDTTPLLEGALSGGLQAGESVAIYEGGTKVGTAGTDGTSWSYAAAMTGGDRVYDFTARVIGADGQNGSLSAGFDLTLDTTAPAIDVDMLTTNDTTPTLTGTVGDAEAVVTVTVGGAKHQADNIDGTWTLSGDAIGPLADGTYDVVAVATDAAGNTSSDGSTGELTIDTTPPEAPTVDALLSSDATPTLTGTAVLEAGDSLSVSVDGKTYSDIAVSGGVWSLTLTEALSDGVYDVTATVTDAAGNAAPDTGDGELTIDSIAPALTIDGITPDSGVAGDFVTNDGSLVISGTAEAGASVSIDFAGKTVVADAGPDGSWSLDHTATPLADGTYTLDVSATDLLGNTATESRTVLIDSAGPAVTSIELDDTTLAVGESATVTITFSEGVSGFDAADLAVSAGGTIGPLSSSNDSTVWTGIFTPDSGIDVDGAVIEVVAGGYGDIAGNPGSDGTSAGFRIDTAAPDQTTTVSGAVSGDTATTVTGLVSGSLASDEGVVVYRDGTRLGTADAADGGWTFEDVALSGGSHTYTARVEDGVGNQGALSAPFALSLGGEVFGTTGNDTLEGGAGDDVMSGLPQGSTFLGEGTIDVLTGGAGADVFLLGNANGRFYDDGNPKAGNSGKSDYALITDFDTGVDEVRLAGAPQDYLLGVWSQDGVTGTGVFFDSDGGGAFDSKDELIGLLANVEPGDLIETADGAYTTLTGVEAESVPALTLSGISDDTGVSGDMVTSDATLTYFGTADAGATVVVTYATGAVGSVVADANGAWTIAAGTALAEGDNQLGISATAAQGGTVSLAETVTLDTVAPGSVPEIDTVTPSDTGADIALSVTGLEPGDRVVVLRDGSPLGEAVMSGGTWSFTDTEALSGGSYTYTARVEDLAGNAGNTSQGLVYDVPETTFVFGTDGSDIIDFTTSVAETISGLPAGESRGLGAGTIDTLTGNGGPDVFVLGDSRGAFYDDGSQQAGNTGKFDYALITDFETGVDTIQLAGAASDYFLESWKVGPDRGVGIVLDSDGDGVSGSRDELIGLLADLQVSDLSLSADATDSGDFVFI